MQTITNTNPMQASTDFTLQNQKDSIIANSSEITRISNATHIQTIINAKNKVNMINLVRDSFNKKTLLTFFQFLFPFVNAF